MAVVDNIPEERLEAGCVVGDDAPVTLRFLIEDYVSHQRWHLKQIVGGITARRALEGRSPSIFGRKKARRDAGPFCLP